LTAAPKPSEVKPPQPPPELLNLRQKQFMVGMLVFILGILVLLLTAIAEAALIPG
jgi:hypothetical protein